MKFPYVAVSLVLIATLGWAAYIVLRRRRSIPQLVEQLEISRADRLYPFVEGYDYSASWNDNALWAAIGGTGGIWEMRRDCGILMTIARNVKKTTPACEEIAQNMFVKAFYLRSVMTWLCVAESLVIIRLPSFPRIHARSYARLYCDMAASLDTVLSGEKKTVPHPV